MMWKVFYLFAVINTLDFPRAILGDGESIESRAESLKRNDARKLLEDPRETSGDYDGRYYEDEYPRTYDQKDDVRRRPYDRDKEEIRRRPYVQDSKQAVLIGKWRNNGEALEPEWRDGDSMPLLPFSHFSYPKDEDHDKDYDSPLVDDVDGSRYYVRDDEADANSDRGTAHLREQGLPRKPNKNRGNVRRKNSKPKINVDAADTLAVLEVTGSDDAERFKAENSKDKSDAVSIRHREGLQVHPNEYEQELNDEEYLKPRPRKRRPPQNYEFALAANEAALRKENSSLETRAYTRRGSVFSSGTDSGRKKNDTRPKPSENALELKSLLKMQQEEGLSLSEILQRRNLTLHDLLRGKADVISVLKSKDFDETLEDIEQVSRAMSDSLMKLSITERPRWTPTDHSQKPVRLTTKSPVFSTSETNVPKYTTPLETKLTTAKLEKGHESIKSTDSNDVESVGFSLKAEDTGRIMPIIITLRPVENDSMKFATTTVATGFMQPTVVISDSLESSKTDTSMKTGGTDEMKSYVLDEDEIMEFSDFPDYKKGKSNNPSQTWIGEADEEKTTQSNEFRDDQPEAGSTLSIEHILIPTEKIMTYKESENKTQNGTSTFAEKIPLNDFSTFFESEYQNDFPMGFVNDEEEENAMKVANDTNTSLTISKTQTDIYHDENLKVPLLENHQTEVSSTKSYEDILSEIVPEARAEIFELFASSSSGKRLERLLKSRNMSLEELIALRQRGSSKVHLASVKHLRDQMAKSSKTEYDVNSDNEPTDSEVNNVALNNRSEENRTKEKSPRLENVQFKDTYGNRENKFVSKELNNQQFKGDTVDLTTILPNNDDREMYKKEMSERNNFHNPSDILDLLTTFASLPFGKTQYRNFAEESTDYTTEITIKLQANDDNAMYLKTTAIPVTQRNESAIETVFVDEFVKGDPLSIDMETTYNSSKEDDEKSESIEKKSLSKVKPSIIASGAILGVTIVVFLAILIACKIRQKQKYTYSNTFSRAVFQGPVTAARKLSTSSSLSAVMVNVVATSTTKRPERTDEFERAYDSDPKSDIDNDSLDANDSWETIPDYLK